MKKLLCFKTSFYLMLVSTFVSTLPNVYATEWDSVKTHSIPLFYPGQSSWEWLLTKHSAAKSVRKGAPCLECHEGEESEMGNVLVSGKKLESNPIKGKPGFLEATIQATSDSENLYFRISWNDPQFRSGSKANKEFESKIAVMLGDDSVREFPVAGCWGVCHNDATDMPSHEEKKSRSLYTSASRTKITRSGGGDNFVSSKQLKNMHSEKQFLEFWQTRINDSQNHETVNGYILEKMHASKTKIVKATVENHSGHWQVTFYRPLKVNHADILDLADSKTFTFGFAIHDDYSKGRQHYVSFPRTFSLNNHDVDIVVTKQ